MLYFILAGIILCIVLREGGAAATAILCSTMANEWQKYVNVSVKARPKASRAISSCSVCRLLLCKVLKIERVDTAHRNKEAPVTGSQPLALDHTVESESPGLDDKGNSSRSETTGPCGKRRDDQKKWPEGDSSPQRLTTARVTSSGNVVERSRIERMVDLQRYHNAIDGGMKSVIYHRIEKPWRHGDECTAVTREIATHQLASYPGQVARR